MAFGPQDPPSEGLLALSASVQSQRHLTSILFTFSVSQKHTSWSFWKGCIILYKGILDNCLSTKTSVEFTKESTIGLSPLLPGIIVSVDERHEPSIKLSVRLEFRLKSGWRNKGVGGCRGAHIVNTLNRAVKMWQLHCLSSSLSFLLYILFWEQVVRHNRVH